MGPFETQVEVLLDEGVTDVVKRFVSRLLAPAKQKLNDLHRLARAMPEIGALFRDAQAEAGEKFPVSPMLRKAAKIGKEMDAALPEVKGVIPKVESVDSLQPLPKDQQISEGLTLTTIIGLTLGVIGGIPLVLSGLTRLAGALKLKKLAKALKSAHEVAHHIEQGVIDVLIPDRLSYVLYRRAWNGGFKASSDLLSYEDYKGSSKARQKTESAMYSILLVYFAWHGLLGAMHYGASLLGSAEASATAIKGLEIARGAKDATGILRGQI